MWIRWVFLGLLIQVLHDIGTHPSSILARAQDAEVATDPEQPDLPYTLEQLQGMTDTELEQICYLRGFQILHDEVDPTTGMPYDLKHDDYVNAAMQCLQIEQEM